MPRKDAAFNEPLKRKARGDVLRHAVDALAAGRIDLHIDSIPTIIRTTPHPGSTSFRPQLAAFNLPGDKSRPSGTKA